MKNKSASIRVKKSEKNCITGLDIGTSKILALIAEITPAGSLQIIGTGSHPSRGLKRGVVVDIEATVQSIQRAVEDAELMAGCEVHSVYTGIAGSHIKSLNSHGIVAIRDREVSQTDVDRVLDAAKAVVVPADQKILHVLPQEFIIDNQGNIREPIGMAGVRLESRVHVVTGAVSAAQNIAKCVRRCGLEVKDIILEQLASSHAVLTEDEKQLGVCVVDMGAGTTDIAVFIDGAIQHTAVIPIAGDQVTHDIAMALRTPSKAAEQIKIEHGYAMVDLANPSLMLDVLSVSERPERKISQRVLADVISARYEELFALVLQELDKHGLMDSLAAGIVLTGGASCIQGALPLAEMVFETPVRQGFVPIMPGLAQQMTEPSWATGVGLLLYGFQQQQEGGYNAPLLGRNVTGIWTRMRQWFSGHF